MAESRGVPVETLSSVAYRKAKGGFFRSRRHINLYIDEHEMRTK